MSSSVLQMQRLRVSVCLIGIWLALSACGEGGYDDPPERLAEGKEPYYGDPVELLKASDVVVRAEVQDISVGRTYGDESDRFTTRFVDLKVLETLSERSIGAGETIRLEEEGWDADKTGYVMNGVLWSQVGDEGFFFLVAESEGDYVLANSYSRVLVKGEQLGPSGHEPSEEGPWREFDESSDPLVIEDMVEEALSPIEQGATS